MNAMNMKNMKPREIDKLLTEVHCLPSHALEFYWFIEPPKVNSKLHIGNYYSRSMY